MDNIINMIDYIHELTITYEYNNGYYQHN
jgi:hypothetical protein